MAYVGRSLRFVSVAICLFGMAMPGMSQVDCGDAKQLNSLGGSNRFSEPITTVEGLQSLFTNERSDIETLLREAGFSGSVDDLARAVSSGSVESVEIQPGERMGWMFSRKGGRPDLLENVCWAGQEAFKGWEIQFSSQGTWYSFVVPEVCGNVAHLAEVAEPECLVEVTDSAGTTCASTSFTIDARGSTGDLSLEVQTPSGRRQTLSASQASSPGRWTFEDPARQGDFTFTVVGRVETPRGNTLECRASETLTRNCCQLTPPGINLTSSSQVVEPGEPVTVTADPTVSDCAELDSVTIGGETVTGRPYQRELTWDTPGAYVVTGTVTDSEGQSATDEVTVRVSAPVPVAPTAGWTLRGFAGPVVDVGDSESVAFPGVVDGELERRHYRTDRGAGLGIELERRFNNWFGLGFGAMVLRTEAMAEQDRGPIWIMPEEDLDGLSLFAAPLFHWSKGRFDLFAGPMLAWTSYDDVTFDLIEGPETSEFDSEVTVGAQVGLDISIPADNRWGIYVGAIWLASEAEHEGAIPHTFEVDPLFVHVGFKYGLF